MISPWRTRLTGGCQCGAVRYELMEPPMRACICHCRMCQKASGQPFMAFATVKQEHLNWTRGTPGVYRELERGAARLLQGLRHAADVQVRRR